MLRIFQKKINEASKMEFIMIDLNNYADEVKSQFKKLYPESNEDLSSLDKFTSEYCYSLIGIAILSLNEANNSNKINRNISYGLFIHWEGYLDKINLHKYRLTAETKSEICNRFVTHQTSLGEAVSNNSRFIKKDLYDDLLEEIFSIELHYIITKNNLKYDTPLYNNTKIKYKVFYDQYKSLFFNLNHITAKR